MEIQDNQHLVEEHIASADQCLHELLNLINQSEHSGNYFLRGDTPMTTHGGSRVHTPFTYLRLDSPMWDKTTFKRVSEKLGIQASHETETHVSASNDTVDAAATAHSDITITVTDTDEPKLSNSQDTRRTSKALQADSPTDNQTENEITRVSEQTLQARKPKLTGRLSQRKQALNILHVANRAKVNVVKETTTPLANSQHKGQQSPRPLKGNPLKTFKFMPLWNC